MTENRQMAYVDLGAVEAMLRVVQVLREAGDEQGALRELAHFVERMRERVMVPLEEVVEKVARTSNGFPWLEISNYDRFRLSF